MPNVELGRLEEVDVREIWSDEAQDFTPWLAEHLDELGAALHLDLQLVESEGAVGSFAVDIVADSGSGLVVIENQLERTDHSHLGQVMTYAAGRDARTLIWITPEFRDEHRATLDWLNRWTVSEIEVYGVEVRAVRIGDSKPAPEFRAVAFPNNWSRPSRAPSEKGNRSAWGRGDYRAFYQPVIDQLRQSGLTTNTRPSGNYWERFASQSALEGMEYRLSLGPRSGSTANVYLYFSSDDAEWNLRIYTALNAQSSAIEEELGERFDWQGYKGYRTSISLTQPFSLLDPQHRQSEIQTWMIEMLPKLKAVFEPRLRALAENLDAEEPKPIEESPTSDDLH